MCVCVRLAAGPPGPLSQLPPTRNVGRPLDYPPAGHQAPGPAVARSRLGTRPVGHGDVSTGGLSVGCPLDVPSPRHAGDGGTPPVEERARRVHAYEWGESTLSHTLR